MKQSNSRGRNTRRKQQDPQKKDHDERMLDKALEDTFPASDPPAQTQPGSKDAPRRDEKKSRER